MKEILYCIRCGSCLNACPVFREIGGHAYVSIEGKNSPYPGPVGSVVSPALFGQLEYGHLARASSLCGACREACPVDIDLPSLLLRVRSGVQAIQARPITEPNAPAALAFGLKLFTLAAASPWRFTTVQRLAGIVGSLATHLSRGDPWMHLPAISGWGYSKDFPSPPAQSFRLRYNKHNQAINRNNGKPSSYRIGKTQRSEEVRSGSIQPIPVIEAFASELAALGGNFVECKPGEVADKIWELLHQREFDQLLVWDSPHLPPGLLEQLGERGIHLNHPTSESLIASSQVRAGLTGAIAGIANTGSLMLLAGPGRPLTASLLPEVHIAVLLEKDIVENLSWVLQREEVKQAPAAIIVTGPSRTADIEMTLTIGVHGPGELHVVCIRSG